MICFLVMQIDLAVQQVSLLMPEVLSASRRKQETDFPGASTGFL